MLPAGEVVHDRYRISALIGHGGMGAVYRAHDLVEDRPVAVKVLTLPPDESRLRFRREFRVMSRLAHPNVVRVLGSGTHDELAYLVMEYLRGGTLLERFHGPVQSEDELAERLETLAAVADALAYVHGEGIVHRDLKPDNVLLQDDVPHLMDFGLAKTDQQATVALTQAGEVMGTVAYMSPEQARGRDVDARSDLYAFGCLLHWAIVGEPPFPGDTFAEILLKQVRDPARPPSARVPFVPSVIDRLTLDLLEKAPADRPAQASDVADLLRAAVDDLRGDPGRPSDERRSPSRTKRTDGTPAQLLNPPLIGRDDAWRRVASVLEPSPERRPVLLEGATGLGVTRLVDETIAEAKARGHAVLRIRNPRGVDLPYHGLRSALATFRDRYPSAFAEATDGLADDLALLLPGLFDDASPPNLPADVARMRVYTAVDRVFARAAERSPLLVTIDDLHEADEGTVALAAHLASGDAATSVGLLLSVNPAQLADTVRPAVRHLHAERVRLEPLGEAETHELIRAMLGGEVDPHLERHVAERAAGNPFFVGELLAALLKGGQIVRREGAWEWSREAATLPPSIDELFARRIELLGDRARTTAAAAAAIGVSFEFETLQALRNADEDELLDDLDELLRANLAEEGANDVYRFAHPMLRETLHARLPARRRRRYHAQLAERLERTDRGRPDELAVHFAEARRPAEAARYARQAARDAERVFANDVAERFYRLALDQASEESADDRPETLVALARVLDRIGRWEEAERLLTEALEHPTSELAALKALGAHWSKRGELDASERYLRRALEHASNDPEIHRALGGVLVERGALDEAERVLIEALSIALARADDDPVALADVQADLGYHAFQSGAWDDALDWFAAARKSSAQGNDPLFAARLEHMISLVHYERGDHHAARDAIQEAIRVYRESGDVQRVANTLYQLGNVHGELGDRTEAIRLYQLVLEHAERLDDPKSAGKARYSLAWMHLLHGDYDRAIEHVDAATTLLAQQGYQPMAHQAKLMRATVLARHGKVEAARAAVEEAETMLAGDDQPHHLALQAMTAGEVALRSGDPDAALALLRDAVERFDRLSATEDRIETDLLIAQAAWAAGDRDGALEAIQDASRRANERPNDVWRLQAAFLRALHDGDPERLQEAEDDLEASNLTAFADLVRATVRGEGGTPVPDASEREAS